MTTAPHRIVKSKLRFHAATPSRWPDIERLFGARGACGGCWCMAWRLPTKQWERNKVSHNKNPSVKGAGNKRAFKKIVTAGPRPPGVIGYYNGEPVAWCAIAPREEYVYFERSRTFKPIDDEPVWSVSCFFVVREFRRCGVSVPLLIAAVDFAAKRGARIIEGYPQTPYAERSVDAFMWTGVPATFERAGFREVARPSRSRPVMRKRVRRRAMGSRK